MSAVAQPTNFFSEEAAQRVVNFIERVCVHTAGEWAGKPFILEPWQRDEIVRPLYGTLRPDGSRLKRTAYLGMPRKNGKSELGAALALYHLFADHEIGGQVFSAAADRAQASIVFNVAADMVELNPLLRRRATVLRSSKRIIDNKTRSVYQALSADVPTKHGLNASAIIFDELHTQPSRELWDVLATSMGARKQPLIVALTTAGYDRNSICYELYSYGKDIARGRKHDDTFFFFCREVGDDADWTDEKNWHLANPSLGRFPSLDFLREQFHQAQQLPSFQNTFRNLYLNQWVQQRTRAIDLAAWDRCFVPAESWPDLTSYPCFGGLDLSQTTDLTAFVLCWAIDEKLYLKPHFFLPEEGIIDRSRREGVEYHAWAQQGFIHLCPGPVVKLQFVLDQINELRGRYPIEAVAFDRWGMSGAYERMEEMGLNPAQFGQGFGSMSPATKSFLAALVSGDLVHPNHPVLNWNADCLELDSNPAGDVKPVKPNKSKKTQRIDGLVAAIMAAQLAVARRENTLESTAGVWSV